MSGYRCTNAVEESSFFDSQMNGKKGIGRKKILNGWTTFRNGASSNSWEVRRAPAYLADDCL